MEKENDEANFDDWHMDSGATDHVTTDEDELSNLITYKSNDLL